MKSEKVTLIGNNSKCGLYIAIALIFICSLMLITGCTLLWLSQFIDPDLPVFLLWYCRFLPLIPIGMSLFLPFSGAAFFVNLEQRQIIKQKLLFFRWVFKQQSIPLERYDAVTAKKYCGKTFITLISENHKPLPLYAVLRSQEVDSEISKTSELLNLPRT